MQIINKRTKSFHRPISIGRSIKDTKNPKKITKKRVLDGDPKKRPFLRIV
jgi:hypothetical protein